MTAKILDQLAKLPFFTFESYKQIAGIGNERTQTARVQLSRWRKSGHLLRIKRGLYTTRSFYEQHVNDADFIPALSAILLPQSYVSTTYVLQRAGILTEVTYPITAVTPKNTRTITNDIGTFIFQHINDRYYHGFDRQEYHQIHFFRASTAKALFDYLYLRPLSTIERRKKYNLAEALRLNVDRLPEMERDSFRTLIDQSTSKKMKDILNGFEEHIWQP